jgi:hypothetical protein
MRSMVAGAWLHDWEHDPFARGAYSYARVGGAEAPRRLAQPIDGTLFFAGEATDPERRTGTVDSAMPPADVPHGRCCVRSEPEYNRAARAAEIELCTPER